MNHEQRIDTVRAKILQRAMLLGNGLTERELWREVHQGRLVRIAPSSFMLREHWDRLHEEERLLARALAAARLHRDRDMVFSHYAAAAIWGLPLYGYRLGRLHAYTPVAQPGRSSSTMMRHAVPLHEDHICELAGLRVTSLSKTLVDLARHATPELALGAVDAGLRAMVQSRRDRVDPAVEEWRGSQLEQLQAMRGARGVRNARRVLELADPRADSVAESVSRLQFARLQMEVEIQVPVRGADGDRYWLDFELVGQAAFGEVDGRSKYTEDELLEGRSSQQRVLQEKRREDDVRGVTGKRVVRWMPDAIGTPERFGRRMLAFGLRVPAMQ